MGWLDQIRERRTEENVEQNQEIESIQVQTPEVAQEKPKACGLDDNYTLVDPLDLNPMDYEDCSYAKFLNDRQRYDFAMSDLHTKVTKDPMANIRMSFDLKFPNHKTNEAVLDFLEEVLDYDFDDPNINIIGGRPLYKTGGVYLTIEYPTKRDEIYIGPNGKTLMGTFEYKHIDSETGAFIADAYTTFSDEAIRDVGQENQHALNQFFFAFGGLALLKQDLDTTSFDEAGRFFRARKFGIPPEEEMRLVHEAYRISIDLMSTTEEEKKQYLDLMEGEVFQAMWPYSPNEQGEVPKE